MPRKPIPLVVPPGVGQAYAEIGTREWADYVRLHSHEVVKRANDAPGELKELCDFLVQHRGWTLMNKPDGTFFSTFEEFCSHRRPWGWGHPYEKLRRILELVASETTVKTPAGELPAEGAKVIALALAPPDRRSLRGHNEEGQFEPAGREGTPSEPLAHHLTPGGSNGPATFSPTDQTPPGGEIGEPRGRGRLTRLQAVRRAPAEVQALFQAGLIGEKVAARLGPRGSLSGAVPDALAVKVEAATQAASHIAAAAGPLETPRQRLETQKKINAEVLRILGPVDPTRSARGRGPAHALERALAEADKLDASDLEELVRQCLERLPAERACQLARQAERRAATTRTEPHAGAA